MHVSVITITNRRQRKGRKGAEEGEGKGPTYKGREGGEGPIFKGDGREEREERGDVKGK